jgi:hypothetical protein
MQRFGLCGAQDATVACPPGKKEDEENDRAAALYNQSSIASISLNRRSLSEQEM